MRHLKLVNALHKVAMGHAGRGFDLAADIEACLNEHFVEVYCEEAIDGTVLPEVTRNKDILDGIERSCLHRMIDHIKEAKVFTSDVSVWHRQHQRPGQIRRYSMVIYKEEE